MGFWSSISDAFSRDGSVTRFFEKVPIIGYGVAGVQAIAGNTDHAKRALATSTGSLITTVGSVGGFVVGGPVGAVAGGALASQVGMLSEFGISKTISDDKVKGDVGELSIKRALIDAAVGGASGLIGGGAGVSSAGQAAGKTVLDGTAQVAKSIGMKTMTDVMTKATGKEVAKAVAAGGASAMAQGAGKGLIQTGKKDPEPKKTKIRVVTINQDNMAKELEIMCNNFIEDFPLEAICDAYKTLTLYWNLFVKVGLPWEGANEAVEAQTQAYENKKVVQNPRGGLWDNIDYETREIIRLVDTEQPLSATQQKIGDMYEIDKPAGFQGIHNAIRARSQLIEGQLRLLRDLMRDEVEMKEI